MLERLAFWAILTNKTVQVLVGAALLRAVRVSEIDFALEELLNRRVVAELNSVVHRDRMYWEPSQRDLDDVRHWSGMERLHLSDYYVARCAIVDGQQAVPRIVLRAVDQIGFPVADAPLSRHGRRSVTNMPFVWLPILFTRAIRHTRLALESKKFLSGLPVTMDPAVDGTLAH